MAYLIAVYDVNQKRVGKMLKLFRRYLTWVQNSVFEGELTEAQFQALRQEADALLQDQDGVVFYRLRDERYRDRIALGEEKGERSRFL
ncbi:CRISPR-associated protein Cas2 [Catalinimonas alkaloidigena]|uniref:CRISPR-associated endoribonuclease Cas2 n=1 Tax=Catalinimonas alkaloidigena TaxID=1075417 RepID=A0A1G9W7J0_9BACT|nr:CRISPR-associated endonuclease Cas2 [Catalinimonas alkaloidigena]SDM80176.1 CRISPR-associated protein Cas2 [Catalinimonas alkaloidigena]